MSAVSSFASVADPANPQYRASVAACEAKIQALKEATRETPPEPGPALSVRGENVTRDALREFLNLEELYGKRTAYYRKRIELLEAQEELHRLHAAEWLAQEARECQRYQHGADQCRAARERLLAEGPEHLRDRLAGLIEQRGLVLADGHGVGVDALSHHSRRAEELRLELASAPEHRREALQRETEQHQQRADRLADQIARIDAEIAATELELLQA